MGRQAARQWPEAVQCVRKREQQPRDSNSPEPQFVMTVWTTCQKVSPHLLAPESSPNVLSYLDIRRKRACTHPICDPRHLLQQSSTAEPASNAEHSKHLWVRWQQILPVFTSTDEFEPSGHFSSLPSAHTTFFFLSTWKSCRRMLKPGNKIRKHVYTCYICSRISSFHFTTDFHIPSPPPSCLVKCHHVINNAYFFTQISQTFCWILWNLKANEVSCEMVQQAIEASAGCCTSCLSRIVWIFGFIVKKNNNNYLKYDDFSFLN